MRRTQFSKRVFKHPVSQLEIKIEPHPNQFFHRTKNQEITTQYMGQINWTTWIIAIDCSYYYCTHKFSDSLHATLKKSYSNIFDINTIATYIRHFAITSTIPKLFPSFSIFKRPDVWKYFFGHLLTPIIVNFLLQRLIKELQFNVFLNLQTSVRYTLKKIEI